MYEDTEINQFDSNYQSLKLTLPIQSSSPTTYRLNRKGLCNLELYDSNQLLNRISSHSIPSAGTSWKLFWPCECWLRLNRGRWSRIRGSAQSYKTHLQQFLSTILSKIFVLDGISDRNVFFELQYLLFQRKHFENQNFFKQNFQTIKIFKKSKLKKN